MQSLTVIVGVCLVLFTASSLASISREQCQAPILKRTCGTRDPSINLTATHRWLQHHEGLRNDLWNGTTLRKHLSQHDSHAPRSAKMTHFADPYHLDRRQLDISLFTVDTYVHVVADTARSEPNSSYYVTDEQIRQQLAYLNNAYTSVGIAYVLGAITRSANDTWARGGDDYEMKKTLRRGTYSSLNLYYQTNLQTTDPNAVPFPGAFLLGFCTLPAAGITAQSPPKVYISDGCNILSGTLPGGWQRNYNEGGTTVHEVGHWNGLLHTFQNNNCDVNDWGDFVADTPQQKDETVGCPTTQDSCPNSGLPMPSNGENPSSSSSSSSSPPPRTSYGPQGYSGVDMVSNFMDYSTDSCYQGFTAGQGARMVNMWVIYRLGR